MSVFNSHLQGFTSGDIDLVLSNMTDDVVVHVPGATYQGHNEIWGLFQRLMQEFGQDGVAFEMGEMLSFGNVVCISWRAMAPDNTYSYAIEPFVIDGGKITAQTIGWVRKPQ